VKVLLGVVAQSSLLQVRKHAVNAITEVGSRMADFRKVCPEAD
jgi:hypothetical protein